LFAIAIAIGALLALGVAQAADQRLSDAQANLEKARALVNASQPGEVSQQSAREFRMRTRRAVSFIDRAHAEIEAAKAASDAG
jgi:hypothetical protein